MNCVTSRNIIFFTAVVFTAFDESLGSCSGRYVLKGQKGLISDGPETYSENAHCEWLIDAGGENKTIQLEFKSMSTECSFDFLFVYDGNSHSSRLLASLSGDSLPPPVIATSGYMLLYLFSDRNYKLAGFEANYIVLDCPYNCSGNGQCSNNTCRCNPDHTGNGCQFEFCPNDCSGNGECERLNKHVKKCVCEAGYSGRSCSLSRDDESGTGEWYMLEENGYPGRTSHTGYFHAETECLWIFGGFDLNNVLDDLIHYCMAESKWDSLETSSPWPEGRRGHAMAGFQDGFYIFGGILTNGSHSNDLWFFNLTTKVWTLRATNSTVQPLAVTGHTLTMVEKWVYLFGGKTEDRVFIDHIYRIDFMEGESWERVLARGGNYPPKCLVGHTTVYYPAAKSLVVFGGYMQKNSLISHRTSELRMFHIEDNYWSQIQNREANLSGMPFERAFHSAVILGNYLVIYGGNTHAHNQLEVCFNSGFHFYHLGCHMWVNHTHFTGLSSSSQTKPKIGRFGHIALAAYGDIMLLAGGYSGRVHGDLMAFKVPVGVAHHQSTSFNMNSTSDHCQDYVTSHQCLGDPECRLCKDRYVDQLGTLPLKDQVNCYHRTRRDFCKDNNEDIPILASNCPGICPALHSCAACASQGQGVEVKGQQPRLQVVNEKCMWCVKEATCQKQTDPQVTCKSGTETPSRVEGWWRGVSTNLTSIPQCVAEDFPAGLHWIKYKNPKNASFPDEVTIIRKSETKLLFVYSFDKEIQGSFVYSARLTGYIHPLDAEETPDHRLALYLGIQKAEGVLFLSRDATVDKKELVVNLTKQRMYNMTKARRPDNRPVFPNVMRGMKYFMEQETMQKIKQRNGPKGDDVHYPTSQTKLEWNRENLDKLNSQRVITYEFLEPYSNGSCSDHYNCLSCLTDTLCSWCLESNTCQPRDAGLRNLTESIGDSHPYLITNTAECPSCEYHVNCHSCASDPLCEWMAPDGQCTRWGRLEGAIMDAEDCNPPCHTLSNCSECINGKEKCAWCKNTKKCLPFSDYVTRYLMGECTGWVDSEGLECIDCAAFNSCKTCIENFGCGWCGNEENPTIGMCLDGDFTGTSDGSNCSVLISEAHNISVAEPAQWMYDVCVDVEECLLGLHDCHPNATCRNTYESYECHCNQGFYDNGQGDCEETCFHTCVHGNCSGPENYQCICQIGWTGMDCNTNCGCNNHSTCTVEVGTCDKCQHHTTGPNCSQCSPGSYGDPFTTEGCTLCDCNGHGDMARGECGNNTGECFCTDNTHDKNCESCQEGYYGDAWNGGKCYLQCDGRMIKKGITRGAVGTHKGSGLKNQANIHCLWILTYFDKIDIPPLSMRLHAPTIIISIEGDLQVDCGRDSVYVYDGIPDFVNGPRDTENVSNAVLLGAFCGMNPGTDLVVQAHSGTIVIYFEADLTASTKTHGFNASYQVIKCPDHCQGTRVCVDAQCVCQPGYGGYFCEIELCPKNCSYKLGQGECNKLDYGVCSCNPGFGGPACDTVMDESVPHLQLLSDPLRSTEQNDQLPSPRVGHTLTTCGGAHLFLFGGYSPEHQLLNDMWIYDIGLSTWFSVPVTDEDPTGRYYHAAACIPKRKIIYVFGGFVVDRNRPGLYRATNDLWKFNIESSIWSREEVSSYVPPLAGHSMNQVQDTTLVLIGGFTTESYFSDKVYEYNAEWKDDRWKMYSMDNLTGAIPIGLYGHSAVYNPRSDTIYVYGGYTYKSDSWKVSSDLYTYDVEAAMWSLLVPEGNDEASARAFHTAVGLQEEMMVVVGGQMLDGGVARHLQIYRYRCNTRHRVDFKNKYVHSEHAASVVGVKAVVSHGSIFLFGGFSGTTVGSLSRLTMLKDVCSLLDQNTCYKLPGCSPCVIEVENKANKSLCYSSTSKRPDGCRSDVAQKLECNNLWFNSTNCYRYSTCSQCLAVYPPFKGQAQKCKWCRNCPEGKCIRVDADCRDECNGEQHSISQADECPQYMCPHADCQRCTQQGKCIWTRNIRRSSEVSRSWRDTPMFNWNCLTASLQSDRDNYTSIPPNLCPPRCHMFRTCDLCLASVGGEGGSKGCIWSETLQECMPPAYRPLRCSFGECGFVIQQRKNKSLQQSGRCPLPCANYSKCSECITAPGCGWCAFGGQNGLGVCMKGGLAGPSGGACLYDHRMDIPPRKMEKSRLPLSDVGTGAHQWAFHQCPPEDECINGHHACNPKTQNCYDNPASFRCECKKGYVKKQDGQQCDPVCHQPCQHGQCTNPDECTCDFGWVGKKCDVECKCNKHSDCRSEQEVNMCRQCHNNTQGSSCDECKENFVGDPKNGGKCVPCYEFCHNHTDRCKRRESPLSVNSGLSPLERMEWSNGRRLEYKSSNRGPTNEEAVCVECEDNTMGDRCDECMEGHFRLQNLPKTHSCMECQCNGHSNFCQKQTGENCLCQNNTESKCEKGSEPCWKRQCSECKEYFMGTPTNNHQCYRQMTVDKEYCFDPETQNNCNREPIALGQGRTVFFVVQPKYLNVNIRITIDVTMGGVDVYFSNKENTFRVIVGKGTGIHAVEVDPLYKHALENITERYKRSFRPAHPESQDFEMDERKANDLNTFITIYRQNTILLVHDVQFRLIITLPRDNHELRTSRFYLILKSQGDGLHNVTYGSLYFRQDQPHIDLFVFFSVFFSCFFLFLAMCVMLWKMKQAFDARRTRQLRAREMECMASRPFAKVLLLVEHEHPFILPAVMPKRTRATKTPRNIHQIESPLHIPSPRDERLNIVPIAIEPTDDGVAAVGTVLVQLPGGSAVPSKLCLGSTLTMRIAPPIVATKARRRLSASSC